MVLVQAYQLAFHSYVADYYGATRSLTTNATLRSLPAGGSIFLSNVPVLGILLPSENYYQYLEPHPNQKIGAEELPLIAQGIPQYVVLMQNYYAGHEKDFAMYEKLRNVDRYVILTRHE